jgi:glycogen debranching enzyme
MLNAVGLEDNLESHLAEVGLGHISEIFEGDAHHRPCGCIAQA